MAYSYADLATHAHSVAAALRAAGIHADEPIHINVSNDPLDLAALLGVWQAGAVAVPIHRNTPAAAVASVRAKSGARFLVDMRPRASSADSILSVISQNAPPFRSILKDAALIIFTSGSTGTPKGVVVAHDAFHGKMEQIDRLLAFGPGERSLLVLNITFSFGMWISLLTLLKGGTLVMQEKFESTLFLQTVLDERITRVGMVPTMMRVLFSRPELIKGVDAVNSAGMLRQIMIGGESLGHSLAETIRQSFSSSDLIDIYGLTETATCDFFSFPADYARHPGCIGRVSPNIQYRIAGADGVALEAGAVGELQLRSPYLMTGYLDEPALTAAAFSDGWFRTGDLARTVGDELVELMGRSKEIISRGGNKVTPVEIEQVLCAHPDIVAAMVVGMADPVLGERIHALVVMRNGAAVEPSMLRQFLGDKLERFKQPDAYYVLDELPLGRTGKADRGCLKSMIMSGAISPLTMPA
jgi:long-chain acyl-CoA synthetase